MSTLGASGSTSWIPSTHMGDLDHIPRSLLSAVEAFCGGGGGGESVHGNSVSASLLLKNI